MQCMSTHGAAGWAPGSYVKGYNLSLVMVCGICGVEVPLPRFQHADKEVKDTLPYFLFSERIIHVLAVCDAPISGAEILARLKRGPLTRWSQRLWLNLRMCAHLNRFAAEGRIVSALLETGGRSYRLSVAERIRQLPTR